MMDNLFSMFDPSTSFLSWTWAIMALPTMILLNKSLTPKSKKIISISTLESTVSKVIKQLTGMAEKKAMVNILVSMFTVILILNTVAILPFNFTVTAHISITFSLSASLWASTMINAISNNTKCTLTHLTPMGTPSALMNFMALIEAISQLIRPITLAVRLMANMVAGHLLLSLLSNFSMSSYSNTTLSIIPMMVLLALEAAVALIQAYVICILMTLYYKETF